MSKITKAQQKRYIDGGASTCPKCKSGEIHAISGLDINGIEIYEDVACYACEFIWTETFTLTRIEEKN